jgi:hypothetical protein
MVFWTIRFFRQVVREIRVSLVLWAMILYLGSVMAECHNRVDICGLPGGVQTEENAD